MRRTQRSSRATSLSCASSGAEVADLKVKVRDYVHVRLPAVGSITSGQIRASASQAAYSPAEV